MLATVSAVSPSLIRSTCAPFVSALNTSPTLPTELARTSLESRMRVCGVRCGAWCVVRVCVDACVCVCVSARACVWCVVRVRRVRCVRGARGVVCVVRERERDVVWTGLGSWEHPHCDLSL